MTRDRNSRGGTGASGDDPFGDGLTVMESDREAAEALADTVAPVAGRAQHGGAAATPRAEAGARILQYELIRELGAGGMGKVFLARDTKLGRRVAIKFLRSAEPSFTERFVVEARTTAQISHENIVVIHEVNEIGGAPFMVLEYLEGKPLSDIVGNKPLPAARAVELAVPVVKALVRAHELGIVHRDLKPDNIFLTSSGTVKVLDFGIAKLYQRGDVAPAVDPARATALARKTLTQEGGIVGTMPYMSPEQWGMSSVDHRSDLWALGIILYEMVAGRHPLDPLTPDRLIRAAANLAEPMPSVLTEAPDTPAPLARVIERCLAKDKEQRFDSAGEVLGELEPLLPGRLARRLGEDDSPYPGLVAFQESDADRFFGRSREIARMVKRVRDRPLTGVAGPSGAGKSSFVRAGVIPALKASGELWESFTLRPGRQPMAALASLLQPLTRSTASGMADKIAEHEGLVRQLRREPGTLGTMLRARARGRDAHILLFVDQFEELYTLVADAEERAAFTHCLAGMADDVSAPLRVVLSMRSDFLDRTAEDRIFTEELTRGLLFLPPPDRAGLREAITAPLELARYRFEAPVVVDGMLDALETTPGALPLLQFAAGKLWDERDRDRRLITARSYDAIGGIAGALASHADQVLQALALPAQKLVRQIFQRLVTPEGTRAIVDVADLAELSADTGEVARLVDHLVAARLLVVQTRSEAETPAVEIVHESLITTWPTLRRWLDEGQEDAAFLAQLRTTAKQWDQKGRAAGLLWRGEAAEEARRWRRRAKQRLAGRDADFLDAVFALATRAARRRRALVVGVIALLVALVAAATAGMVVIRKAEKRATEQMHVAKKEAARAKKAEKKVSDQLEEIRAKERARLAAVHKANEANQKVVMSKAELKRANAELTEALAQSKGAQQQAERESKKARASQARAEQAAAEARRQRDQAEKLRRAAEARARKLEKERSKITTHL